MCDGQGERKYPENVCEPQIAPGEGERVLKGGRRGWGEAAGAVRSPVRSAGETQFTLPCRHPG